MRAALPQRHDGSAHRIERMRVFAQHTCAGRSEGPTAMDAFWSVVVGVAAEMSAAAGGVIDIAELLAENGLDQI